MTAFGRFPCTEKAHTTSSETKQGCAIRLHQHHVDEVAVIIPRHLKPLSWLLLWHQKIVRCEVLIIAEQLRFFIITHFCTA